MTLPVWLQNAELGLSAAEGPDKLIDLAYSAQFASQWLDTTRVQGSTENQLIARRALTLFTTLADTTLLSPPLGAVLSPIRAITLRLKGLVQGTDPHPIRPGGSI